MKLTDKKIPVAATATFQMPNCQNKCLFCKFSSYEKDNKGKPEDCVAILMLEFPQYAEFVSAAPRIVVEQRGCLVVGAMGQLRQIKRHLVPKERRMTAVGC